MYGEHLCAVALTGKGRGVHTHPLTSFFLVRSSTALRLLLLLLFLTFSALVANPKKLIYTVAIPARGLLNRGKKKKKSGSAPPAPPRARCSFVEITRRIHISRRSASRRYEGGLGPSRIRTRIPTTRQLGQ